MSCGYLEKSKKRPSEVSYSSRNRQKWDGGRVQKLAVIRTKSNDILTRIKNEILEEEVLEESTSGIS